jgi:hypothetical protein
VARTVATKELPMDADLDALSRDQLLAELVRLRQAARAHRDSPGHELWSLLPDAPRSAEEFPGLQRGLADDILRTYLHVQAGDGIARIDAPDSFWGELASGAFPQLEQGRLMSASRFSSPWQSWERHPAGEELVMLLSGAVELVLEAPEGRRRVPLAAVGEFALIPAGIWHTATTATPSTLLFLTPGAGTEHRPA